MNARAFSLLGFSLAVFASAALGENWAQWRGPNFNGTSDETGLPSKWTAAEAKWKANLPGPSGSTPAVWGDSIFVSTPDENQNLLLLCLDRKTGQQKWQKNVMEGGNVVKGRGNSASPSPVTDGKAVFILYSTGDFAAFDFNGQELWHRHFDQDYGRFSINWLYGSSPLLYDGKLYVQILQRTPVPPDYPGLGPIGNPERESFILCIDPATGKNIWKHKRDTTAISESFESYATPIPHVGADGKVQLLIAGGDCLSGHDLKTGAELWRGYGLNRKHGEFMRLVVSPVSAAGLAIACGPKKEQMLAFRTDMTGDITDKGVAWSFDEKRTPDVCTPAFYKGRLYVLDGDSHTLTCLNPKDGQKIWQGQLTDRATVRSSPTVADGKVYILSEKGNVTICGTGDKFEELASIPMGDAEGTRASIVVSDGDLFIRTTQSLYCVGK